MRDILLYALAVVWMPGTALMMTYVVSRDTDRMIAKARKENAERVARLAE